MNDKKHEVMLPLKNRNLVNLSNSILQVMDNFTMVLTKNGKHDINMNMLE